MASTDDFLRTVEPDREASARELFDVPFDLHVPAFSEASPYVPRADPVYRFDPDTTLAILLGFAFNRRVLIHGSHGTGKSTHVEQVASRLNWPCVRVNLDSHISRLDLLGKDAIRLSEGKQITEFVEGIVPWSFQRAVALCFDEYDAGRPDVMFVIQRILEAEGRLTLLDQSRILDPHPYFRLFATANTNGLGDASGLYHGTQQINQGQMDRWSIVTVLNYLPHAQEVAILCAKCPSFAQDPKLEVLHQMVRLADLTRRSFAAGDISTLMSPRTVLSWCENYELLNDLERTFRLTFLNKCDQAEYDQIAELYRQCFDQDPRQGAETSGAPG